MNQTYAQIHQAFWSGLSRQLREGTRLVDALQQGGERAGHPVLKDALARVTEDIINGLTLHEALARQSDVFSRAMIAIVHAGEVGGGLDAAAHEIAQGVEDGTCPLRGVVASPENQHVLFWKLLGLLLSSGVPMTETLDVLSEEIQNVPLREAARAMRQGVAEGRSLSNELGRFPDVFEGAVREAVAGAEERGELDKEGPRIAEALQHGDLSGLGANGTERAALALTQQLLLQGIERRASDIHMEPTHAGAGRVRFRVDGVLHDGDPIPQDLVAAVLSRLKTMAGLDVAERRLPQDGRILLNLQQQCYDFRVCVVPCVYGERVVIRVLARTAELLGLSQILSAEHFPKVKELCHLSHGLVICAGPMGSGKTTLMYAMLNEVDRDQCCVMSIEDPVEMLLDGVTQIQTQPQIGLTFARAARAVLRQDPDVIMIGEIRDLETGETAVKSALTGHLVLTQLHTNSCAETIKRLLDMGIRPFMVNASLAGVISQRLLRCLCHECRQPAEPQYGMLPAEIVEFIQGLREKTFYAPKGCEACHGTGHQHRVAVHEILRMNERIAQAVVPDADVASLHHAAVATGMKPMFMNGLELAARGVTSLDEVWRVLGSSVAP